MNFTAVLYVFVTIIVMWALDSINITNLFKKNKYYQACVLYILVSMALSYLVVNFLMDLFISTKIY